jgi:hypothetical protein
MSRGSEIYISASALTSEKHSAETYICIHKEQSNQKMTAKQNLSDSQMFNVHSCYSRASSFAQEKLPPVRQLPSTEPSGPEPTPSSWFTSSKKPGKLKEERTWEVEWFTATRSCHSLTDNPRLKETTWSHIKMTYAPCSDHWLRYAPPTAKKYKAMLEPQSSRSKRALRHCLLVKSVLKNSSLWPTNYRVPRSLIK